MAASAQAVTCQILEKIPKCKLIYLHAQVPTYVDEEHQNVYGVDAYAR